MTAPESRASDRTVLRTRGAALSFSGRTLWSDLDLELRAGEFLTVLGSNGSGKSSLLKALLGVQDLSDGTIDFPEHPGTTNRRHIGYIPQQRLIAPGTPMRGRDLVAFGVDGHRLGPRLRRRKQTAALVDAAISAVGGSLYADRPIGQLSGGEQQRLRVAQALVTDPAILVCDEPLASLDLYHQQVVSTLIDRRRREHHTAVLFVTHDINPVLPMTDRVLYFAQGRYRLGAPGEVLRSDVLSELYGTRIDVAHVGDRVVVLGAPTNPQEPHHDEVPA